MAEKQTVKVAKGRILQKIDKTVNWEKATNFIPLKGEICIYDDGDGEPKIKVGDGLTLVSNLPFVGPEAITEDEIDSVCNASITYASELKF